MKTTFKNNPKFYTQNGWEGKNYNDQKGAKEVAKELRAYIKSDPELNACKWSITSKWGMNADSLRVSLMAAPFDPFSKEYKEKHESRYNRGYSEHGTVKDFTSQEAFRLIEKVRSFVMQYIHDDSDSMIDYFDRNIYDFYEIGKNDKPFQLLESKGNTKQNEPESGSKANLYQPEKIALGLEIVDYSEKAIAVFGDTKKLKEQLKEIGGRFNSSLKYNVGKRAGWIFSKKQADKVRDLIAPATNDLEDADIGTNSEKSASIPSPVKNSKVYTREVNGMMVTAYFIEEEKFMPKGEYKETTLDEQKKEADILLKSIDGNWYTIYSNIEIELKNKQIRRYDNGCIAVPESMYNKLKAKYNVMSDF